MFNVWWKFQWSKSKVATPTEEEFDKKIYLRFQWSKSKVATPTPIKLTKKGNKVPVIEIQSSYSNFWIFVAFSFVKVPVIEIQSSYSNYMEKEKLKSIKFQWSKSKVATPTLEVLLLI